MFIDLVQIGIALHERFCIQRQKKIGWVAAKTVTKETRGSDSRHGERLVIEIEQAANYRWIRSVLLLPEAIAHYSDRRSIGLISGNYFSMFGIRPYTGLFKIGASNCDRIRVAWIANSRCVRRKISAPLSVLRHCFRIFSIGPSISGIGMSRSPAPLCAPSCGSAFT